MRIGQNPAKSVSSVHKPERITVAVLNYIPFLSGYFSQGLDVLKISLSTLRKDAGLPFDLMVFDNGSCREVQDYLVEERNAGSIQFLILSEKNLGKGGAWNIIFSSAPGEIIAYSDGDVRYSPGWLLESVKLLEIFPNVGMVTARPFFSKKEYISATIQWAQKEPHASLEIGKWIPWETFYEFNLSLGQSYEEIREGFETTTFEKINYKGLTAIAGASHWQFVGYRSVLSKFLPFDMDRPMGQVKMLDQKINAAGYLRLMLPIPYVFNMSNTVHGPQLAKSTNRRKVKFHQFPIVRKVLLSIYDWIFRLYYSRN